MTEMAVVAETAVGVGEGEGEVAHQPSSPPMADLVDCLTTSPNDAMTHAQIHKVVRGLHVRTYIVAFSIDWQLQPATATRFSPRISHAVARRPARLPVTWVTRQKPPTLWECCSPSNCSPHHNTPSGRSCIG